MKRKAKTFEIVKMEEPAKSYNGKLYIRCHSKKRESIDIWGHKHVLEIKKQEVPFKVRCVVKRAPIDGYFKTKADFWVFEDKNLEFIPVKKQKIL